MGEPLAVYPGRGSALGLASLARNTGALARTLVARPGPVTGYFVRGEGRVVFVIPAFLAGDWATARLRHFLHDLGYRVETAGVIVNPGPTPRFLGRIETAFLRASAAGPIAVIGQSLGGVIARDLARRHPEKVRRLITLCSPIRAPITTPLAPAARALSAFYDPAWLERRGAIASPPGVPVTALYSEDDGVVDWRECLQDGHPDCENVKVSGEHATIGATPEALTAIAQALSS